MNYFLRTNNSDMTAYGGFQWPTTVGATVVAPDWDPIVECGKGLHGLKGGRGNPELLAWCNTIAKWVVFSSEEDGVDLGGKWKVQKAMVEYIGDRDGALGFFAEREGLTVREWVCKDIEWVYWYALMVDRKGCDDTRRAACSSPEYAYWYARFVDQKGREDTRRAACNSPEWAYRYALNVDEKTRDDTREAVSQDPKFASLYAQDVTGRTYHI